MITQRRLVFAAILGLFAPIRARAQGVAGLSKLPWNTIFSAVNAALAAIPFLREWFQAGSQGSKSALCQIVVEDIIILEAHCHAVALALDANLDGPVVPPERGSSGIIPA